MRIIASILLVSFTLQLTAAKLYLDRKAHIWFHSEAPMETIEAHNRQCSAILNATEGTVAFKAIMKSFEFKNATMQEHFNENYVESDKYPNATFDGNIANLSEIDFENDGSYKALVEGKLTIHGVTNEISQSGTITVENGKLNIDCKFTVKVADYDIKIPQAVVKNIAEEIDITVDASLSEYKR